MQTQKAKCFCSKICFIFHVSLKGFGSDLKVCFSTQHTPKIGEPLHMSLIETQTHKNWKKFDIKEQLYKSMGFRCDSLARIVKGIRLGYQNSFK